MALTRTTTARTHVSSQSCAAGATVTGAALDLTTAMGGLVQCRITNGATGPTIPCTVYFEGSTDGTTWRELLAATASTANNAVSDFAFNLSTTGAPMYFRNRFTGNTVQSVTVESTVHEVTSVST